MLSFLHQLNYKVPKCTQFYKSGISNLDESNDDGHFKGYASVMQSTLLNCTQPYR